MQVRALFGNQRTPGGAGLLVPRLSNTWVLEPAP